MQADLQRILHPHNWILARYAAQIRFDPRSWGSPSRLVDATYHVLLKRSVDPEERERWSGQLQCGEIKLTGFIWQLLCSNEFQDLHPDWSLPRDTARVWQALHQARCLLVQNELPAAHTIADLGGASIESPSGALLWMGYPHPVREITIIDLPPSKRMKVDGYRYAASESADWTEAGYSRVRYIHTSMTDMSALADRSVDMVWAGQSIEHITIPEADQVYAEAIRVLKPEGHFCLDTVNRALTGLQYPFGYLNREHKHEYRIPELVENVLAAGFDVRRVLGICPMPRSAQRGRFYPQEILDHVEISEDAETAYFFYIESIKPSL
jgi:SAM-dependent methyltransferase